MSSSLSARFINLLIDAIDLNLLLLDLFLNVLLQVPDLVIEFVNLGRVELFNVLLCFFNGLLMLLVVPLLELADLPLSKFDVR